MDKIIDGISRFQDDVFPHQRHRFRELASGQSPEALFITCSDSRIDPNLITQTEPGDLFICRNAGNIVPPHSLHTGGMTASIEYAVAALGIEHIILCGHTDCGAMRGALHRDKLKDLPHVSEWLAHSDAAVRTVCDNHGALPEDEKLLKLIEQNVVVQMQHLRTHPYVASRLEAGRLQLHAWVYDIAKGTFTTYNEQTKQFEPLRMEQERESIHKHVAM